MGCCQAGVAGMAAGSLLLSGALMRLALCLATDVGNIGCWVQRFTIRCFTKYAMHCSNSLA